MKFFKNILKEFAAFLNHGNLIEIASGLLLASAFNELVKSFNSSFIMPIINRVLGFKGNDTSQFEIFDMHFVYGDFISSLISFVIVGFTLFLIVKMYNKVTKKQEKEVEEVVEDELVVLKEIRELLKENNKNKGE